MPGNPAEIDISVIATDCISEGQNLQDCDYLRQLRYSLESGANYPALRSNRSYRQPQCRVYPACELSGRIWTLDDYIHLKVARRNTHEDIRHDIDTGDDDLINADEKGDLEYRKQQLKRLQEEVVDIEDMSIRYLDYGFGT
jgi:hypothetical protein